MSGSVTPAAVKIAAEARSSESTAVKTASTLALLVRATMSPATPPRCPDVVRNDTARFVEEDESGILERHRTVFDSIYRQAVPIEERETS
jgi:hypothetical protein